MVKYFKVFPLLIIANIAVYVVQLMQGVDWNAPEVNDILTWGGNAAAFTLTGEYWRLFTSMFVHYGLLHIALNLYMLFICGMIVERAFGSIRFTLIYIFSGLFSGFSSAWWHAQHKVTTYSGFGFIPVEQLQSVVSAGASGAIMGITGAYLAQWLVNKDIDKATSSIYAAFAQTVVINLVLGFMIQGVDNAAHIGGLLSGIVIGGLLSLAPNTHSFTKRASINVFTVLVCTSLLYLGMRVPPSQELVEMKSQVIVELEKAAKEKIVIAEQIRIADLIRQDEANAVMPVDEKIAAGEQIITNEYANAMLLSRDGKRIYILGDTHNALKVIDLETQKIVKTILGPPLKLSDGCNSFTCMGVGASGIALSPDEHVAYVTSMVQDSVSVIDLTQDKIIATIPVGRFPRSIVASAAGNIGYVFNSVDNTISVVDLLKYTQLQTIKLDGGSAENLPFGHPVGIWLSNNDQQLIALDGVANQLSVFNASTMQKLNNISMVGDDTFYAGAISSNQKNILYAGYGGIGVINLETGKLEKYFAAQTQIESFSIALSPDNKLLALPEPSAGHVRVIKLETCKTVGVYPVAGWPAKVAFAPDGQHLYAINNGDGATRSVAILTLSNTASVQDYLAARGEVLSSMQISEDLVNPCSFKL